MASFFGEVRPLSSRAVNDEEADNQPKYEVSIEKSEQKTQSNVKLIIFSVGEIASIFVKSHFLPDNSNLISSIKYSCEKDDEESTFYTGMQSNKNVKNVTAVSVFASTPDVLICDISKCVPDEICYEVTELIFKNYMPSEVLILTSKHMATYKGENSASVEMPFLKCLSTSNYTVSYSCNISRLDPPNILSNMPASLLLRCEITKVPALCIVNFVDTDAVDFLNVHIYDEVLNEVIVSKLPINADAKSKVVKLVKAKQSVESNLYI